MRGILLASAAAGTASILFGASVVATRFVINDIDPLLLAFIRYLIATLCLAPVAIANIQIRPGRHDLLLIVVLGVIFFGLFPWFFSAGLRFIPASRGALWIATMPFLTFALATVLHMEVVTWPKITGLAMATSGVAIVLSQADHGVTPDGAWLGDLLFFATACCGAVYFVLSRPVLQRLPALFVTCLSMASGTAFLGVVGAIAGKLRVPVLTSGGWLAVAFLGTLGAAIGFYLWVWALQHSTPTRTAIFATFNPMTAMLLGVALLGEPLSGALLLALALVLAGVAVANFKYRS